MGQQASELLSLAIGMFVGAVICAAIAWLILRRLSDIARSEAKSESQTEIVRLNERVRSCPAYTRRVARRIAGRNHSRDGWRGGRQ